MVAIEAAADPETQALFAQAPASELRLRHEGKQVGKVTSFALDVDGVLCGLAVVDSRWAEGGPALRLHLQGNTEQSTSAEVVVRPFWAPKQDKGST